MGTNKEPIGNSNVVRRRQFMGGVAGGIALAPLLASAATTGVRAESDRKEGENPNTAHTGAATLPAPARGYLSFGIDEAAFVQKLVNVMCPADELTPSGVECGLDIFFDRQLSGGYGKGEKLYMRGPWRRGKPQQGYQLSLTPEQYFKAGVAEVQSACTKKFGKSFDLLGDGDANSFLTDLAAGKIQGQHIDVTAWFNELVYPLFNQACFADPVYGGNVGKVFWKMVGFPGLPATYTRDVVTYRGKPHPAAREPKSIADFA